MEEIVEAFLNQVYPNLVIGVSTDDDFLVLDISLREHTIRKSFTLNALKFSKYPLKFLDAGISSAQRSLIERERYPHGKPI